MPKLRVFVKNSFAVLEHDWCASIKAFGKLSKKFDIVSALEDFKGIFLLS